MYSRLASRQLDRKGYRLNTWLLRIGKYGSILLGVSGILLIWLGAFYFVNSERGQTERDAKANASNLSLAFEEQIIRSIRAADQTLIYVRETFAKDPQHFDISLWARDSRVLSDFNFQVAVINSDGRMITSSVAGATPGVDLSDREHFRVHRMRDTDELFISKPVLGRVSNKWSIQVTRRITMSDGSFGGVVVVSLDPQYLTRFYQSIDIGQYGVVTLVGADGIIRARGSRGPSGIGESIAGGSLLQFAAAAPVGDYVANSQIDGVERLFSYRMVRGYPLIVNVGLGIDEVFEIYNINKQRYFLIASVLTIWLAVMAILMLRYQSALASARDKAEAGIRARTEFLAMMSHEIRTPMNGVVGMAELLLASELGSEQRDYALTLRQSTSHLLQIINDVLDFSKLEADRIEIEKIPFDARSLVNDAIGLLDASASEKHLVLSADVDSGVPEIVVGDPARIRQVLLNLVGNALKFTNKGHVDVRVTSDVVSADGRVRLSFAISDTGIGIPADGIPLLFREFSQLDSSIARRFGGTGLGLAICKRLVGLMGGSISIESAPGRGTTFTFVIECAIAPARGAKLLPVVASPSMAPVLPPPGRRAALRILLAEDNKTNQLVVGKLLESLGFQPDIASNGLEAVEACKNKAYDVVLMDVMMPEMDGLSATKAIRQLHGEMAHTRIIALTANAQTHDREVCLEAGMDDFLAKPVTRDGLAAKLMSASPLLDRGIEAGLAEGEIAPLFDERVYASLGAVLGDDAAREILREFLADVAKRFHVMQDAVTKADGECLQRESHTVKSSSASLGFSRLSRLARELEQDALGLEPMAMARRLSIFAEALSEVTSFATTKLLQPFAAAAANNQ